MQNESALTPVGPSERRPLGRRLKAPMKRPANTTVCGRLSSLHVHPTRCQPMRPVRRPWEGSASTLRGQPRASSPLPEKPTHLGMHIFAGIISMIAPRKTRLVRPPGHVTHWRSSGPLAPSALGALESRPNPLGRTRVAGPAPPQRSNWRRAPHRRPASSQKANPHHAADKITLKVTTFNRPKPTIRHFFQVLGSASPARPNAPLEAPVL